jgi:mRNA-degrading endonuclease YafQ of YafQ-DinJ toxin-antitoxin module
MSVSAWSLVFTDSYLARAERFLRQHPDLTERYFKTIELLEANPHHPSLRLHALSGRLNGLHSISINLSYRITLEMEVREHEIVMVNVGTHEALYR